MRRLIRFCLPCGLPGFVMGHPGHGALLMGEFVLFFVSLFSIVNPFSAIPTFVGLTGEVPKRAAGPIAGALGKTGMNVAPRFMGLILAATAIEFITSGLGEIFPGWTTVVGA